MENVQRVFSYDKWEDKEEEIEGEETVDVPTDVVVQEERKEKSWWNPFNWKWVTSLVNVVKRVMQKVVRRVKKTVTKAMRAA